MKKKIWPDGHKCYTEECYGVYEKVETHKWECQTCGDSLVNGLYVNSCSGIKNGEVEKSADSLAMKDFSKEIEQLKLALQKKGPVLHHVGPNFPLKKVLKVLLSNQNKKV